MRKPVIALIGDSFAFGLGVEYPQTFGAVMESRFPKTVLYNFGVGGFGMDQMWQTLRTEALPLEPSLVVVAFISPDFSRTPEAYRPDTGCTKPVYAVHN